MFSSSVEGVLDVAVPTAAFLWVVGKLIVHPKQEYVFMRVVIAAILLLAATGMTVFLFDQDNAWPLAGSLLAGGIAYAGSDHLLSRLERWEELSAQEREAKLGEAGKLPELLVPAIIGLVALLNSISKM